MPKVKCPHCPVRIAPERLEWHISLCIDGKPFPCDICGKRFALQAGVNNHKGQFHTADELKSVYRCRYCEYGTNEEKHLIRHELKHKIEGGPGFSRRSRSRSRGFSPAPVETNRANPRAVRARSTASAVNRTTINLGSLLNRSRSKSASRSTGAINVSRSRSRSRSAIRNTSAINPINSRQGLSHRRFKYSPSRISPEPERYIESSSLHSNWDKSAGERQRAILRQSVSNNEEFEMGDEMPTNRNRAKFGQEMPINMAQSTMQNENTATAWNNIPLIHLDIISQEEAHLQMGNNWDQLKQILKTIRTQNNQLREQCIEDGISLGNDFVEEKIKAFEAEFGMPI